MSGAYFDQFNIVWLFGLTNSATMMGLTSIIVLLFLNGVDLIPKRWQSILELTYSHFYRVIEDNLGGGGVKYFSFVLSLFFFVVCLNVLGLCPYVFTPTVHIIVTLGLSFSIIIGVTLAGFWRFKWDFFSVFMPSGAPLGLAPLLVLIETVSYVSRAISLGVRLAANLSAGHLLFAILAGFGFNMLIASGPAGGLPLLIMVFITLLEVAVAVIQAYVFCLLTTIYLADTLILH
uniref:ATP synthase F0 subunit 6 n=1 Tax=Crispatotrochus rubescens TaxID=2989894 RepID=UPI002237C667|nr:ATP synthase F0 subunit 6 [Crispatotrochus rubescens]YP_010554984.1 ATP synthase F0 subunit 6 [Crispatotrochus rugosus]UYP50951.1 ATP synthase subunit 6 [Crispatotrochus rubescens]UYP50964.1 ATP synthase subunit 6 [Crispatotrochus rugosus]